MTQLLLECEREGQAARLGIACQENEQVIAQLELEQHISDQADAKAPFALTYSFDYNQFDDLKLQTKARTTLFNFLGFVRSSFDGLLACGRALQDVYSDCLAQGTKGKKIFEAWLKSADFGASRYIASSAMEIRTWFDSLTLRLQRLVTEKVQSWSVAALRQLTKVSTALVKELVGTGKKTAAQIKTVARKEKTNCLFTLTSPNSDSDCGSMSCNTNLASQASPASPALKSDIVAFDVPKPNSTQMFTAAQVEQKIAEALAQRDKEKAEEELGRFVELRDAARLAVTEEIQATKLHAQKMTEVKEELIQQLVEKERELERVLSLQVENQQLEQRIVQLEKALQDANKNSWGNTFSNQATKVLNSQLEKTITPLMSEIERLKDLVLKQEQELVQLQVLFNKQLEEQIVLHHPCTPTVDAEVEEQTTIAEERGNGRAVWLGWLESPGIPSCQWNIIYGDRCN
ncbi:MAG: hypothetical protein PUP91_03055 [Rhizonema sp. PD37]|nr:hypothetical protein [Rhizonema sp. PD37]